MSLCDCSDRVLEAVALPRTRHHEAVFLLRRRRRVLDVCSSNLPRKYVHNLVGRFT